jgi:uncharacterized protein (UPF0128 family)
MDITRTIQANEKEAWVNQLFDGTLPTTYFPLPAVPKRVNRGVVSADRLYGFERFILQNIGAKPLNSRLGRD